MSENLADRLEAVERALTDGETDLTEVRERAALAAEVDRLQARVEELETQVEQLDAGVEAVRGYAGNVRAVNREVERRASAALAKAEALETAVDAPVDDRDRRATGRPERDLAGPDAGGSQSTTDAGIDSTTGEPTDDEFDWGDVEGNSDVGRSNESSHTGTVNAAGGREQRVGSGDRADESGTEQFIERVRDAL